MILNFGETKQGRWARGAGIALCLLVLVFAFAAKLSWYQPKGVAMRSLTSSKMWQHEAKVADAMLSAPEDSGSIVTSSAFLLVIAVTPLLLGFASSGEWLEREKEFVPRRPWSRRVSQLRAPPVR
ncbi:MAG TPA: hypothetical protein VGG95_13590 [Edaphobacter sp.]